jgi:hypothetical protein
LPWHHSVIAFRQCTTRSGSYEALRGSVCSMSHILTDGISTVNGLTSHNS